MRRRLSNRLNIAEFMRRQRNAHTAICAGQHISETNVGRSVDQQAQFDLDFTRSELLMNRRTWNLRHDPTWNDPGIETEVIH